MLTLSYNMTNTKTGKTLGVYNERTSGGSIDSYVGPFDTIEECKQYCDEYYDSWHMGYNGRASLTLIDGKHYAFCTRWTSCD